MTGFVFSQAVLASDHAGYGLKGRLGDFLQEIGCPFCDLGTEDNRPVDYPDCARRVAASLERQPTRMGVLICGTGIGMSIAANRFAHLRAALCCDTDMARLAREHNDANVLVLGAEKPGQAVGKECVEVFLRTEFTRELRHLRRLGKIENLTTMKSLTSPERV